MKLNQSIILSVVIHLVLIGLMIFNFSFSKVEHKQSTNPQVKINARAINANNVDKLVKKLEQKKQNDKRKQEQRLKELKKAEQEAERKRKQEEKKTANALEQRKKAEQQRIAEEKKAIALKKKRLKEEKEQKKKAEAERKRKIKEKERKAKAEAERKRKEREKKRKAAEEKARQEALQREMGLQMEAEAAALAEVQRQQVMTEVDKYVALIEGKIQRNWIKPEQEGFCDFSIQLAPGGLVIAVKALDGQAQHCQSGERAIYKAEPLPVSNDPDVFEELKSIKLTLGNKGET